MLIRSLATPSLLLAPSRRAKRPARAAACADEGQP